MSRFLSYLVRSRSPLLTVTAACFVFVGNAQSQERRVDECCSVISIDRENSVVYARHTETGRVLQVGVDMLDIRSVRIGDRVGATLTDDSAVVTSIAGVDRNYTTVVTMPDDWRSTRSFEPVPDDLDDCCDIISIDGENMIVYARHTETGRILQFPVDEVDIRSVRIGDRVGDTPAILVTPAVPQSAIVRPGNDILDVGFLFRPRKIEECCTIVANAELLGVTGRLVVEAPEGVSGHSVTVLQAGTRVRNWYGNAVVDLLPGDYDITLNGVLVTGVRVNRQMDTTIRSGALSVNLTDDSGWAVYDEAQETRFNNHYGTATIALPIGVYAVSIAGGWLRIEIVDGEVTTL